MGDHLAAKILRERPDHQIDVVIPVPDTSRTAAIQVAYHIGAKFREGFIKNRYIGRTFIMPGQAVRKKSVRQKLNPISLEFRDKNVLLVDDSIVRGTTCSEIIRMAREAGAKSVNFASASPAGAQMSTGSTCRRRIDRPRSNHRAGARDHRRRLADHQDLDDLRAAATGEPGRTTYEDLCSGATLPAMSARPISTTRGGAERFEQSSGPS